MATRFEIVRDQGDSFCFVLRGPTGEVLLRSRARTGKITVQNDILHARKALREPDRLISQADARGQVLQLQDGDGSILASSERFGSEAQRDALAAALTAAAGAPMVDLSKRAAAT